MIMSKDFCRVDYYTGIYEYLKNDTPILYTTDIGETIIEYRNHKLMKNSYYYQRIKRMSKLPEGKKINTVYRKENYNDH